MMLLPTAVACLGRHRRAVTLDPVAVAAWVPPRALQVRVRSYLTFLQHSRQPGHGCRCC